MKEMIIIRQFEVEVKETLSRIVIVLAYSELDAMERVREHYRSGKLVLDADDYAGVRFNAREKDMWGK